LAFVGPLLTFTLFVALLLSMAFVICHIMAPEFASSLKTYFIR
jgi:hypothetical protein